MNSEISRIRNIIDGTHIVTPLGDVIERYDTDTIRIWRAGVYVDIVSNDPEADWQMLLAGADPILDGWEDGAGNGVGNMLAARCGVL